MKDRRQECSGIIVALKVLLYAAFQALQTLRSLKNTIDLSPIRTYKILPDCPAGIHWGPKNRQDTVKSKSDH